jgi:hypothetical protein
MLVVAEGVTRAIVTDLSTGGLFVTTSLPIASTRRVEAGIVFPAAGERPRIWVRTWIVRRKRVPQRLLAASRPGLGLEVRSASPNFERLVTGEPFLFDFRVELRGLGTPKVRVLTLRSENEEEALDLIRRQARGRWEVVSLKAL